MPSRLSPLSPRGRGVGGEGARVSGLRREDLLERGEETGTPRLSKTIVLLAPHSMLTHPAEPKNTRGRTGQSQPRALRPSTGNTRTASKTPGEGDRPRRGGHAPCCGAWSLRGRHGGRQISKYKLVGQMMGMACVASLLSVTRVPANVDGQSDQGRGTNARGNQ